MEVKDFRGSQEGGAEYEARSVFSSVLCEFSLLIRGSEFVYQSWDRCCRARVLMLIGGKEHVRKVIA